MLQEIVFAEVLAEHALNASKIVNADRISCVV